MIVAKAWLSSSRGQMLDLGEQIGLKGEALEMFAYALHEVKIAFEVEEHTGRARIVAVDDRRVEDG